MDSIPEAPWTDPYHIHFNHIFHSLKFINITTDTPNHLFQHLK